MISRNLEASEGRDRVRSWPPEAGLGCSWTSCPRRCFQCAFLTRLPVMGCEISGQKGQKAVGRRSGGGKGMRIHKIIEKWSTYFPYIFRKFKPYLTLIQKLCIAKGLEATQTSPASTEKKNQEPKHLKIFECGLLEETAASLHFRKTWPAEVSSDSRLWARAVAGKGWHFLVKQQNAAIGPRASQKSPASSSPKSWAQFRMSGACQGEASRSLGQRFKEALTLRVARMHGRPRKWGPP